MEKGTEEKRFGKGYLHEGEVGSLLALCVAVEHSGEGEFRVEATEEAVEGGGGGLVCRVHAGGRVHRDGGVAGGGLAPYPGAVGVAVTPRPGLQGVGAGPGRWTGVQLEGGGGARPGPPIHH